jgi:hypothetical protein
VGWGKMFTGLYRDIAKMNKSIAVKFRIIHNPRLKPWVWGKCLPLIAIKQKNG